jgi:predicted transposase YbfD/YdcC
MKKSSKILIMCITLQLSKEQCYTHMLTTFLADLKDFRRSQGQRYELHIVILFSIMAICCNAKSFRQIEIFIKENLDKLSKDFTLKWERAPAYTTIRNHIKGLDSDDLEGAFRAYTQHILPQYSKEKLDGLKHICVDGKVLCGSADHSESKRAAQELSFFDTMTGLILAHAMIEEKTNEIPVFQQWLQDAEIQHAIYSADALHCQKKTFEIADEKAGLLIQVKDNQSNLLEDIGQVIKLEKPSDKHVAAMDYGHGRIVNRNSEVYTVNITDHLLDEEWARYIKTVIKIERNVQTKDTKSGNWSTTNETAIYVSNRLLSAEQSHWIVKNHWGIENKNHYVRDVSLLEDAHRIRKTPFNYSVLRSFVLNILRKGNLNDIKNQLYRFSQNWSHLYSYQHII